MADLCPFPPLEVDLVETRTCPDCGETYPIDEFERMMDGKRTWVFRCHTCTDKARVAKKDQATKGRLQVKFQEIVQSIRTDAADAPLTSELAAKIVKDFNGVDGFAKFWYDQIVQASVNKPGGAVVLGACKDVAKLIDMATQQHARMKNVTLMADDDLAMELWASLKDHLAALPIEQTQDAIEAWMRSAPREKVLEMVGKVADSEGNGDDD